MTDKPVYTWTASNGVATITLDNPPRNAYPARATAELMTCLDEIEADQSVRAVVITSAGDKFFSVGADVSEFPEVMKPGRGHELAVTTQNLLLRLEAFPKPTICAINGLALGFGCLIAIACDMRIAAENAQIGLPEVKLAVFPGGGGTLRLPRLVGEAKAKEMLLFGDAVNAQDAYRIGLMNRLVPVGQAASTAQELAAQLAGYSAVVVQAIKETVHAARELTLKEGVALEIETLDRVSKCEDAKEGMQAFLEKRKPQFRHR
ncbi:MAG: enoyl-CoA hydratase [Chloroflexota bacterium]|nr:MAG: enoyl-CoA hydratase [Chloroflexota bacterium]